MTFLHWWKSVHDKTRDVSEAHYELMKSAYETGKLEEREACAKLCEGIEEPKWYGYENPNTYSSAVIDCADAIRERSNAAVKPRRHGD